MTAAYAQRDYVDVYYHDGTSHVVKKSDIQRIEIGGGTVSVVPKSGAAEQHAVADVAGIYLLSKSTAIATAQAGGVSLSLSSDAVRVKGVPAGESLTLYNVAGQAVATVAGRNGEAAINLAGLQPGTYVVKAGSLTRKFVKQ